MKITLEGKKENVVESAALLLEDLDDCVLTLTIERTHPEDYCATLVTENLDGTTLPDGCEKLPTTSTHPHSHRKQTPSGGMQL